MDGIGPPVVLCRRFRPTLSFRSIVSYGSVEEGVAYA